MPSFSRSKGIRNELKLRDEFRKLGYESRRMPLSGSQDGFKGDVVFEKNGKSFVAEVKARKDSFEWIYHYLRFIGSGLTSETKHLSLILGEPTDPLCVISYDLETVLHYNGGYWALPSDKLFRSTCKKLLTLMKVVKDSDILVVKDDRKPFIYIRYIK